ncbi:30S ribosomal protein S2 [candidate division TM6 bacterium RIFCSPHIGHO2_12_FULL_38_8]|nr:MAG: 30S ribosomal protein S2 [candidate division TM6 bacterium RIFCSPHIGHO2_12_FULL_38_8]
MIDFRQLIDVGLHFGHQKSRWCPKMEPYIWGHRGGVHLIDISKTAHALQKTATFLETVVARGETVLWVGTKKPAKEFIHQAGIATGMPYVDYRWVGGTITNFQQVKKAVTKLLYYDDILAKANRENSQHTKKEIARIQKLADRLRRSIGGLKALQMPIGAVIIIDVRKEETALLEATVSQIPVVGLVDTNSDPSLIDYVIPGNDDSAKGIAFVIEYLQEAVKKGLAKRAEMSKKAKDAKEEHAKAAKVEAAAKVAPVILTDINIDLSEEETEEDEASKVHKPALKKPSKKLS